MRRSNFLRIKRRIKKVYKKGTINYADATAILSYYGWIKHCDSSKFNEKYLRPYISLKNVKELLEMKQRTYSDIKPEKKFSIENVENGKCTVLFFDDIKEEQNISNLENEEVSNKKVYSYDTYSIEIPYRENLAEVIENDLNNWLKSAKEKDYNETAAYIRKERDALLYATDKYIIDDYPISSEEKAKVLEYRQELRDLPEQEGFPYNVVWPTKDKKED